VPARLRRHLTFANVMASLALFVALGGSGVAAFTIGSGQIRDGAVTSAKIHDGAVTSAKIRNGAVTSAKIAPGALRASQFAPGQLPAGPPGPAGPTGPQGPAGSALPDAVFAGATLHGSFAVGGTASAPGQLALAAISFPVGVYLNGTPAKTVVVRVGTTAGSADCGVATTPSAAPGTLCLFETSVSNISGDPAVRDPLAPALFGSSYGATVRVRAAAAADFFAEGTWAISATQIIPPGGAAPPR